MNKQTKLIQNSMALIAAGLGDKLDVRVTVSGTQAWTDGKTINIPDFYITSKEQKDAVLGYISHEAAHLKFHSLSNNIIQNVKTVASKNYWNIFEDIRIEKAMIESMIGTKNWLNQIWLNRLKEGTRLPIGADSEPSSIIFEYLLMTCRVHHRGQLNLMTYLDAAEDQFCLKFGYKLMMELSDLLNDELHRLSSSEDAYQLALKVESLIANHEPEDDNDSDADGDADGDAIKAAIRQALASNEELDDMMDFESALECLAQANPECQSVTMPIAACVNRKEEDKALTSKVRGTSTQLTAKLQSIVEEETRVKRKTKSSGLALNSRVLHRYAVNDARLFKSKTKKRQIDTIVEICIDNSGSMMSSGGDLLTIAKEAQLSLAMALERINGVSVTASAFPIRSSTDVMILLSEGESVRNLAKRYHAVNACGRHTPTASAMLRCIKTVLDSRKSKKVIIMITDGFPKNEESDSLSKLTRQAQQSGITVIGVAIGGISNTKNAFYSYFPNALFIQDIKDLKSELFKVAKDILVN